MFPSSEPFCCRLSAATCLSSQAGDARRCVQFAAARGVFGKRHRELGRAWPSAMFDCDCLLLGTGGSRKNADNPELKDKWARDHPGGGPAVAWGVHRLLHLRAINGGCRLGLCRCSRRLAALPGKPSSSSRT